MPGDNLKMVIRRSSYKWSKAMERDRYLRQTEWTGVSWGWFNKNGDGISFSD